LLLSRNIAPQPPSALAPATTTTTPPSAVEAAKASEFFLVAKSICIFCESSFAFQCPNQKAAELLSPATDLFTFPFPFPLTRLSHHLLLIIYADAAAFPFSCDFFVKFFLQIKKKSLPEVQTKDLSEKNRKSLILV